MASHFLVIKKKQQKKRQPDESGFKQHKSVKKRDKIKKNILETFDWSWRSVKGILSYVVK